MMEFKLEKFSVRTLFVCAVLMISGCAKDNPDFSVQFEDLGLSVKWGETNLGAKCREDSGCYYSWGETETKSVFDYTGYKWMKDGMLTKYCLDPSMGEVDGKSSLDIEDDAARSQRGAGWRMPTLEEFQELQDKCTWIWSELNGVRGFMIISKVPGYQDRYIFLPAAGYNPQDEVMSDNYFCYYWMSEIDKDDNTPSARILKASAMNAGPVSSPRYFGVPIRPVHE